MSKEKEDFLSRLIRRVMELQPSFTEDVAVVLETQLRAEFAGEEIYVRKSPSREQMEADIKHRFNGRNALALAHEWGISRASVYRIAKRNVG